MKKKIISSILIICILLLTFSALFSCESTTESSIDKLGTPVLKIVGDKIAWDPIPDAIGYEIDTGTDVITILADLTEYKPSEDTTIKVRAIGDGAEFSTGEWSQSITYNKNASHIHADGDSDGACDGCGIIISVVIDFYAINDLHGKFCDTDGQPGVDELASYLKNARETDDYAILLSSGDMWQGSAESNLTGGHIMTEWMNELGFVSMTLGNHEFDWGEDFIRSNLEISDFPFLAINIYDKDTDKLADYCTPSVMVDLEVIQVGIIGAIGDCYSSISSDMVEGVYFKTGSELSSLVKAEAEKLRGEGADLIVYSLHDGYSQSRGGITNVNTSALASYYQSSLSEYVDVIFEGHSHKSYVLLDLHGDYHLQGGGENRGISHAEIRVSQITGEIEVTAAEIVSSYDYSTFEDDEATEALEDKYSDVINKAYETLGYANRYYSSDEISDMVAKLYLEAGVEKWGEKYNIVLGGGYINTRSPYDLAGGSVCYADVLSLLPFNNRLTLCSIRGDKLISKFLNSRSYYVHLSSYGETVKNDIDPNGTYYVIVDTYTQLYRSNGLTLVEYYDEDTYARDLLAKAIKDGRLGTAPSTDGNYKLTDIADLIELGETLGANEPTAEYFYVKGKVIDTPHPTYGNLTIEDSDGNRIYIYGLYDAYGNRYDKMSDKLKEGDEITVYSCLYYYVNPNDPLDSKLELKNAVLIDVSY